MAYWDTSCLLKLYAPEPDSAAFASHVRGGATIVTSALARFELHAALCRKEAAGDLRPGGAGQLLAAYNAATATGHIAVIAITPAVESRYESIVAGCYRRASPILLRTLDGIHLATAVVSGESEVVVTDKRLRDAAASAGLTLFP